MLADGAVRLIASDLDGTLLGADGWLTDRTIGVLQAADAAGIEIVAATGRSYRTAVPRLAEAGVVRTAICSNGATVFDLEDERAVLQRLMVNEVVGEVLDALRAAHPEASFGWVTPEGFGWEEAFVTSAPPDVQRGLADGSRADEIHRSIDDVAPTGLTKLLVGHPILRRNEWLAALVGVLPDRVVASTSGAGFVEITGEGVDKASTLALHCAEQGIDRSEVLAFGDQANDVSMLAWAGRSVAVANAHEEAQAAADEVAGHHADDAVADMIEALLG